MPARNTIEVEIKANDQASSVISSLTGKVASFGQSLTSAGATITAATAPIALGLGASVMQATSFNGAMTNVAAVLGRSTDQMTALNAQVLKIGTNSRAGPQAAAEAFYDIVGGVADASSHMAILEASIRTAEAGSAELGATTNALVAIMNSYKFGAEDASYASDVLSRTVGMGVGSMNDFAAALPQVSGLAKSLGISFGNLGAMTGYLTTQGNTASQATTQLAAMMTSLLNPNETMKKGLEELGFASGTVAIEQLGLVGAMQALQGTSAANTDGMAKMLGSVEALRGVTALAGPEFGAFTTTFTEGIGGATAAAQNIQLESAAAKFDLLKSSISGVAIQVGDVLLPVLVDVVEQVRPVVTAITDWIAQNPEATGTIVMVAGAAALLGPVLMFAGAAITTISTALGILFSPAVLAAGAIAAIVAAAQFGYPGGIAQLLTDAATSAQRLGFILLFGLNTAAQAATTIVNSFTSSVIDTVNRFREWIDTAPGVRDSLIKVGLVVGTLAIAYGALQLGIGGYNVVVGIANGITWALAAAKGALAVGATAASMGVGALAASMAAALIPILAIAGAIAGVVAAVDNFNNVTSEGRGSAYDTVRAKSAQGQLTEQQLWEQVVASTNAEFGAGPLADFTARNMFEELKGQMLTSGSSYITTRPAGRDMGGRGYAGEAYAIGTGAQPEVFIPQTNGTFVPNGGGGGGDTINLTIHANSYEGGRAAASGSLDVIKERQRARGSL